MGNSTRQLKAMLRKNWLLKIRHPFITSAEILLPTIVMLLLIAVRTRVDLQIHPAQAYIKENMLVEVGKGISPNFQEVLEALQVRGEFLAFAPDTKETRMMINFMSIKFPLLQQVSQIYKDELELETYLTSDFYGTCSQVKNCLNPKIKGAVVFHYQGPQLFDYSLRLNHTWAFSGFPDVRTIMDVNGPYLDDLELGVNIIPTMQYSSSAFFTLQQVVDSFIIFASQQTETESSTEHIELPSSNSFNKSSLLKLPWTNLSPSKIRIAPFPTREYTDDQFQSIIKRVMGVLYLLGFLYPISRLISYSVFEKEQKIREGLYMMGLKDGTFHLSWFIAYALQFAISSGIITACTMNNLFKYSDKSVVFVYFFSFGLSAIMLSFLISTFFTRAKTAVAVGTLSFFGAFFPYYTVNDPAVPMILKVLASLLSPTAFALGSVNFADYERAHVGLRWSNIWRESSGVNFLACLLMMLFDTLIYCAIGLYLDKVLPRENGMRYPWNFLFQKCFWRKKNFIKHHGSSLESNFNDELSNERASILGNNTHEPAVEAISLDMKQQELDKRCIQIRNLRKVYASKRGNCCAVNSLQLTLYENQILALLGHNGAGKSTTISMLVGLLPPTSGDALVFGKNITTDMDEIRNGLGVCPQNDILFPELTVREHLEIFAALKGVKEDILERVVTDMVNEVGLADKVNTMVRALSGGMKRKLSLGIALIGNSKVVILDEPTSGMDPYSMRLTWQLIKRIKKGRIILLTTHSMDEADELGDRIAIMANGSLKCCGSSLFLKHQYGVGYTLTLVKSSPTASVASDIVYRHVPSATCVSEVGTEISFKLPLASSVSFESMFREIESCMRRPVSKSETSSSEDKSYIGIESYGISVTTLEEVFLRVAGCGYDETDDFTDRNNIVSSNSTVPAAYDNHPSKTTYDGKISGNYKKILGFISAMVGRVSGLIAATILSFINFLVVVEVVVQFLLIYPCLLQKRLLDILKGAGFKTLVRVHTDSLMQRGNWLRQSRQQGPTLGPILLSMSEFLMSSFNESYQSRYGAIVMDKPHDDGSLGYTILHNSSCQHAAPTFINLMNSAILRLATGDQNMTIQTRNHPLPMTKSQHLQHHDLDAFSAAIIVNIAFSFIPASFAVAIVKEREVKAKHQQLISGVSVLSYWVSTYIWDFISFLIPSSFALVLFYIFGLDQFIGKNCFLPTLLMLLEYGLAIASSTYCLTFCFSEHSMAQNVVLLVHFFTGLILMVISFIMGLMQTTASANNLLKNFFRLSPGFCFADGLASLALLRQGMKDKSSNAVFDWNVTGASLCYLGFESIGYFLLTLGWELLPFHKLTPGGIKQYWRSIMNLQHDTLDLEPLLKSPSETDALNFDEDIDVQTERNRVLEGSIDNAIIYLRKLRKVYPGEKHRTKVAVCSLTFSVQAGECFGFLGTNGAGKTTTLSMLTGEESPTDGSAFIFGKDMRSNPKAARRHIGYCPQFDALLEFLTVQEHLELYARIKGVADYRIDDVVMEKLLEFDLLKHANKPSFTLSGGNKRKLSVAIAMIGDPPIVILDEPSTGMDPIAKRFMWEVISRLSTRQGKTAVILTTHSMNEAQALCTRIGIMVGGRLRCIGSPQHLKTRFGNHLELEIKPSEVSSVDLKNLCQTIQSRLFDIPSHPRRNEESVKRLVSSTPISDGVFGEQLSEQLVRDGGIPLPIFSEWWLAIEKFSAIDSFILSSFHGTAFQGFNGLSVKYQLPYSENLSLADVFGLIEQNRKQLGIAEYSISQSTLETIFNHFAASS
ncbi:ATP-BINDING CASSETTE SUB-FAMILY A (ABC1) MEMBER 3B [Salix koriyanagi]|uniref:ATP-BINDING CASSETTE SUB-FAMILY A (ABC1) MEMBER 3B n=1 Tax=Salix koriyanagi TaxID=2511006 RepID=A0A9Q0VFT1_9ROSI|nr:ATP-BINDING CASSETTE SUB-FAMILY A (ABC1) MEMBER 3B [Salix koriyanagi]